MPQTHGKAPDPDPKDPDQPPPDTVIVKTGPYSLTVDEETPTEEKAQGDGT